MTNDYLLKTAVACRVARIDRTRFNEAIKAGHLPFAPDTSSGRSRFFDEPAEIGLYVFARNTEQSLGAAKAGHIANLICEEITRHPDEWQIAVCYSINGSIFVKRGSELPDSSKTLSPAPWRIELYDIENIRAELMHGVNYERRVVGGPDDE